MSVRKTERKLPGGIANADAFGFAAINANENVALISYLSDHLVFQFSDDSNENKPLYNTYVVFVDDTFLTTHAAPGQSADEMAREIYYVWKFQLLAADESVIIEETYDRTHKGILHINSTQMADDLYYTSDVALGWEAWLILPQDFESASFFRLSVELYDGFSSTSPLVELSLLHYCRGTAKIIEYLKSTHDGNNQGAYLGREPVTRMVANDYRSYLLGTKKNSHLFNGTRITMDLNTAPNVMAGLMYQHAIERIMQPRFGENDDYESNLNLTDEGSPDPFLLDGEPDLISNPLENFKMGVVQVKPHILAMFLPKDENWTTYTPFQHIRENDITEEDLFDNFARLSPEEHIDIYNYLRFPKSNIQSAALILDRLKAEHSEWANLQTEGELGGEPECVRTIATEFWQGPQVDVDDYSPEALKSFPIGWSPYIQAILLDNSIEYETIHIKVLDVRSGQPIPYGRVKKIAIKAVDANENTLAYVVDEFSPYSEPLANAPLALNAQRALKAMGYDIETPSGTFGPVEKAIHNVFLSQRVPNDTSILLQVDGNEDPSVTHLQYIIDEYHDHRATDESGDLHVRVPIDLLHGNKVHLEVGFWEFPIVLEKVLSNTENTALIRPTSIEGQTDFIINWILDFQSVADDDIQSVPLGDRQTVDWEETIEQGGHFGWKVESDISNQYGMFKVGEKLVLKDHTQDFLFLDLNHFSDFYDEDDYPFHFVFFGMRWCQPLVDELPDGLINNLPNEFTLSQNPSYDHKRMHLITHARETTNGHKYAGKVYGKIEADGSRTLSIPFQLAYDQFVEEREWREAYNNDPSIPPLVLQDISTSTLGDKWRMRLYARIGDPVFAMRSGLAEYSPVRIYDANDQPISPPDRVIRLIWPDSSINDINYHHLTTYNMNYPYDFVLPGQVIGIAGRSSTQRTLLSDEPGYLGLYFGQESGGGTQLLIDQVDEHNQVVFPTDEQPYLFPCRAQVTQDMMLDAAPLAGIPGTPITLLQLEDDSWQENFQQQMIAAIRWTPLFLCQFKNPTYVNHCWAAAELRCPHYVPAAYNHFPPPPPEGYTHEVLTSFIIHIQTQLRFLNERSPDGKSENFAKDNNPQYYHPGDINGDLSWIFISRAAPTLDTNTTVQILQTAHEGKMIKVRFVDDNGDDYEVWVEAALRGSDGRLSTSISGHLGGLETEGAGRTRVAIYFFRKEHGLLNYDNYQSNFSFYADDETILPVGFDNATVVALNIVCSGHLNAND